MTDYISGGYLWITDGTDYLKIKVKDIYYWLNIDPTFKHYGGGGHMFYDLEKRFWNVLAEGIFLESHQDWYDFQHYLIDWHDAGGFTVSIYRDTGGTNVVHFYNAGADASSLTMAIAKNGLKRGGKVEGETQYWKIDGVLLEQCG